MNSDDTPAALGGKKSTRRLARQLLYCAGSLVVLFSLFYLVENWRGRARFAAVKQRIEGAGQSLEWKAFIPPPIPDAQNIAMHPLFRPLCEYKETRTKNPKGGWDTSNFWLDTNGLRRVERIRLPTGWSEGKVFVDVETNWARTATDLARWQTCFRNDTNFPSPLQAGSPAQDVLLALGRFESELSEVHEALSRPMCRFSLLYNDRPVEMLQPHLSSLKGIAGVLRLRAAALLAGGRTEEAFLDVADIFRLGDALKNETTLIAFLVRVAVNKIGCNAASEGLALGLWNDSQLVRLQSLVAAQDLLDGYTKALKSEVAIALQTIDTTRLDGGFAMFVHEIEPTEGCRRFTSLRWVPRGWFEQNKATAAEYVYEGYLPMVDVAGRRLLARGIQALEATRESMRPTAYNIAAKLMISPLTRSAKRVAFGVTRNDLLLVACALERHRLADRRFPDSPSALVPRFAASLPLDIFTGEPLRYRTKGDDGFVLWSVGWNERDEGGEVKRRPRGGIIEEEGDWAFELPSQ